jgi:hypothetical protein
VGDGGLLYSRYRICEAFITVTVVESIDFVFSVPESCSGERRQNVISEKR